MPLLDPRTCDRLYHMGTDVPRSEHIVPPGNLCAGYPEGHKDACQVCKAPGTPGVHVYMPTTYSLTPRTHEVPPRGSASWPPAQRHPAGTVAPGLPSEIPGGWDLSLPFSCRVTLGDP